MPEAIRVPLLGGIRSQAPTDFAASAKTDDRLSADDGASHALHSEKAVGSPSLPSMNATVALDLAGRMSASQMRSRTRRSGKMKAGLQIIGVSSLAMATSVASAITPMETALHNPELVGSVTEAETKNAATVLYDQSVSEVAYSVECAEDCNSGCGDLCGSLCAPTWKVRAGAAILNRSRPESVSIIRPAGGLIDISTGNDFDMGYAGGPDVSLERRLGDGPNSVEVRFLGGLEWNSLHQYGVLGNIDIGPITIPSALDVNANYQSKLNSTEINLRHQRSDRVTLLAGFRVIELSEDLNYSVDLLVPNLTSVNWNTNNHMYGTQVGADVALWRLNAPLSVNGLFKAGVYGNNADNDFTVDFLGNPVLDGGANGSPVAFVGEIGVTTAYQITPHFALRGGYQLLWISGAALAAEQAEATINALDQNVIDTNGDVFYHGALVGGEFTW